MNIDGQDGTLSLNGEQIGDVRGWHVNSADMNDIQLPREFEGKFTGTFEGDKKEVKRFRRQYTRNAKKWLKKGSPVNIILNGHREFDGRGKFTLLSRIKLFFGIGRNLTMRFKV